MSRGSRRKRLVSGGLISLLGVVLAAVVLYDMYADVAVQNDPVYTTVLENALPLAVNGAVVATGYWLAGQEEPRMVRQILVWTGISVAGLLCVTLWVYGFQLVQGEFKPLIMTAQIASFGTVAGIVVGLYSGRQKLRRRRLETLYENTGALMTAETPEAAARCGIDAVSNTLGPAVAVAFVASDGVLEPVAKSDLAAELYGDLDAVVDQETPLWRVYDSGEPERIPDERRADSVWNGGDSASVSEALLVPLSGHGVLSIGAPRGDPFDEEDRTLARILASNIETALDSVAREQELRARERELAQQNERLESFTSVVSHDLRNPLSVAEGYTEIAKEETDGLEAIGKIDRSLDRMDTLIEDLLAVARQGETIDEVESVELEALARDAWATVETAEATLRIEDTTRLDVDPGRCQQLLENLFRNAIEHGGAGVTVTVGPLGEDGFYVADDGPGIPSEAREDVFEEGYTTAETGTGFGLAIVREIVEAHGGTVSVTEGRDGGARFEIRGFDAGGA